jgi:putative redox protein
MRRTKRLIRSFSDAGRLADMTIEVETRNVAGQVTAVGAADSFTLVVDRPVEAGGGGRGFSGGQLLFLAVAGCVSNDLFREAAPHGISLDRVVVRVSENFTGDPAVSTDIQYEVEIAGDASEERMRELVEHVDRIAEIPNSLRGGTPVVLRRILPG